MKTPERFHAAIQGALPFLTIDNFTTALDGLQFDIDLPEPVWDEIRPLALEINAAIQDAVIKKALDWETVKAMRVGELLGWE